MAPTTADLTALLRDAPTDLTALLDAVRETVEAAVHDAHRALSLADETVYTIDDVLDRVPWSRKTVDKMVARRQIPMCKIEGRWVITAAQFREAAAKGFPVPSGRVRTLKPATTRRAA